MRMPKMNPDSLMKDFTPYVAKDGEGIHEPKETSWRTLRASYSTAKQNLMKS